MACCRVNFTFTFTLCEGHRRLAEQNSCPCLYSVSFLSFQRRGRAKTMSTPTQITRFKSTIIYLNYFHNLQFVEPRKTVFLFEIVISPTIFPATLALTPKAAAPLSPSYALAGNLLRFIITLWLICDTETFNILTLYVPSIILPYVRRASRK